VTWINYHYLGREWSANLSRYESLLDQGFHRDLTLLLQLRKVASAAPVLSAKKPPQSDRGLIEGQAKSAQISGSSAVVEPSLAAPGSHGEQSGQDDPNSAEVNLE